VGFTTSPRDARSSTYATDVARMLQIPVFHVNGEDVEAVAQAVLLAVDFRQRFHRDVVIDLWCYRKYGHNEGDEPSFTQPVMYRAIAEKRPLPQEYAEQLARAGVVHPDRVQELRQAVHQRLETAFTESAAIAVSPGRPPVRPLWAPYHGGSIATAPDVATAVDAELLRRVGRRLVELPAGFTPHPKLARIVQARAEMAEGKRPVDWGMAELLAFGTLAWTGTRIRLSGQDSRRGTFSHRHGVLFDYQTGRPYLPIAHLRDGQGPVELRDSPLSEAGVLGFEYGYSLEMPQGLVLWEAQYGDFVNGAQVIVDQFIASAEAKWSQLSGLVLLLPHGMEGAGPEHSSARLERFLALAVDDNWQVIDPTTPAQYFHALRRQVLAPWRKPLVVMAPKSILRHPQAISPEAELTSGGFRRILPDPVALDPAEVTRVVLCSGRIFYDLLAAREASQARHVAIVRLEQLYPLRDDELLRELARYPAVREVVWAQDQPRNMGAWPYVDLRLAPLLRGELGWSCVSRPFSASPAAGSATRHKLEQDALVQQALGEPSTRTARAVGAARSND
jgi:2-oxoglutarate dehydrogenase E1 component